jgi:hypothetical protein
VPGKRGANGGEESTAARQAGGHAVDMAEHTSMNGLDEPADLRSVDDAELRSILQQAVEGMDSENPTIDRDDIVVVSWDEGDDGEAVLLDAQVIGGDQKNRLGAEERAMLLKVVRDYLDGREALASDDDEEKRARDEL